MLKYGKGQTLIIGAAKWHGLHNLRGCKMGMDNTKKALARYDAMQSMRDKAWDNVMTVGHVVMAEENDRLALRAVQDAFHEDTKDINSSEMYRRPSIDFIRRMAA